MTEWQPAPPTEKIGKQKVVTRDNEHYGIGKRQYVTNVSKARELTAGDLSKPVGNHKGVESITSAVLTLRTNVRRPRLCVRAEFLAEIFEHLVKCGHSGLPIATHRLFAGKSVVTLRSRA